ncbi:MAG: aminotransferase class III-fold pyridoxal phosphate-dependent enzyme, partial [Actinobacteria bacterium]|nr:aminotransferase class III-fold pyridoxal phosphate-dependent enzyme [Actinomycetota bacterium]
MSGAIERSEKWVMPTYRRLPVTFVRGEGVYLFDDQGGKYLDFVAGIAVAALGHAHPAVTDAVARQAGQLVHTSNLYYTEPSGRLAEALCDKLGWPDGKVFFASSGAEANECAIKLVRRWASDRFGPSRFGVIATQGSFHGRTLGALAATGQPAKWEPFGPMPGGFSHVAYNDTEALADALDGTQSGMLVEAVQGEGGVVVPSDGYLASIRKICDEHDLALVVDEVQSGTWVARLEPVWEPGDPRAPAPPPAATLRIRQERRSPVHLIVAAVLVALPALVQIGRYVWYTRRANRG